MSQLNRFINNKLLQHTRRSSVSCGQFFDTTLGPDWLVIGPISVSCDLCEDLAIYTIADYWPPVLGDISWWDLKIVQWFFRVVIVMCHCLPTSCCAYRLYIFVLLQCLSHQASSQSWMDLITLWKYERNHAYIYTVIYLCLRGLLENS